jgi:hypothetical protein
MFGRRRRAESDSFAVPNGIVVLTECQRLLSNLRLRKHEPRFELIERLSDGRD